MTIYPYGRGDLDPTRSNGPMRTKTVGAYPAFAPLRTGRRDKPLQNRLGKSCTRARTLPASKLPERKIDGPDDEKK
jgi:hypothetical protein